MSNAKEIAILVLMIIDWLMAFEMYIEERRKILEERERKEQNDEYID